jgi:rubrerythrin
MNKDVQFLAEAYNQVVKGKSEPKKVSNCCEAPETYEHSGLCSKCKEHAEFAPMEEAKKLSKAQKKIAAAAPPPDKITGADFKALKGKKKDLEEAYQTIYENVEDKNYVPTLEEIKDYLHNHYKGLKRYYTNVNSLDVLHNKVENIDKTAKALKQIIDDAKFDADEHNHKYADAEGTNAYTVWDRLYSDVSDDSKDLNGFRTRTNFQQTPTIMMALLYKDIRDAFRAKREKRNLDWAGGEEDKGYEHEFANLAYTINDDQKVTHAIVNNIDKGELSLRKALTDIVDSYRDKGDEHTYNDAKEGVKSVVEDNIKKYESAEDFDRADLLKAITAQL